MKNFKSSWEINMRERLGIDIWKPTIIQMKLNKTLEVNELILTN